MTRRRRTRPTFPFVRNATLYALGVGGLIFEVMFKRPTDYELVPWLIGMIAGPSFLANREERRKDGDDDNALPGG
jgi:hypothetical protein